MISNLDCNMISSMDFNLTFNMDLTNFWILIALRFLMLVLVWFWIWFNTIFQISWFFDISGYARFFKMSCFFSPDIMILGYFWAPPHFQSPFVFWVPNMCSLFLVGLREGICIRIGSSPVFCLFFIFIFLHILNRRKSIASHKLGHS